jgi:hypothetical protein
VVASCFLMFCVARPTCAQERAPNGQIYGELLPFVGLNGVRVQVLGTLLRAIYNLPVSSPDPAKDATGLGQTELEQLNRAITDDIADAFRRRGVPLLGRSEQYPDVTPRLEVEIQWSRVRADTVVINITTRLMEAGRLIKDASKIIWGKSWEERPRDDH